MNTELRVSILTAAAILCATVLAGGAQARELTFGSWNKMRDALMREVYDKFDYARF